MIRVMGCSRRGEGGKNVNFSMRLCGRARCENIGTITEIYNGTEKIYTYVVTD
jgi:hypothetical protein